MIVPMEDEQKGFASATGSPLRLMRIFATGIIGLVSNTSANDPCLHSRGLSLFHDFLAFYASMAP